jgi:paraquat-inducible protein B
MAKQANKTLIGVFVVGAVILAVVGVMIFASGQFFADKSYYVLYFEGNMGGLDIGAPVNFRGVKIGAVTNILVRFESDNITDIRIPVFIEIEPGRITESPEFRASKVYRTFKEQRKEMRKTGELMQLLIANGLKAQLVPQSFVTGKVSIQFDFHPDKPITLVGSNDQFLEIPTIPSMMEEITKTIEEIPFKELIEKAKNTIEGIDRLINSPELKNSIVNLDKALQSLNKLINTIDGEVKPLTSSVESTLETTRGTLETAQEAIANVDKGLSDQAPVISYELSLALKELTHAARSLKALTDYLQQHPESLLRGKGGN